MSVTAGSDTCWIATAALAYFLIAGFNGFPFLLWAAGFLVVGAALKVSPILLVSGLVITVIFGFRPLRASLISSQVLRLMKALKILPRISKTERVALEAGNVWVEAEFFSGRPDFKGLLKEGYPSLTPEEQAFIDGPVEELCKMSNDWQIWMDGDLPKDVWDFMCKEKFLGMIIPKEYGGLGFSAMAHSEVVMKLGTRSIPVCITAMVPNSLGPAELIANYGTQEQKDHYLPKLARGEELPCFALTEPMAGSDAGAMAARGVVFKDDDGELKINLNWEKRYITLAAISTLLGLAFKLDDPEGLLGKGERLGITCALVPTNLPGVILGKRHDPLGVPFYNCPTLGKDVVIPVSSIVGGAEGAGHGWKMLMECLAAGRGISLPAQSTGQAKQCLSVAGAHTSVRRQFGLPLGKFEGIAEPLARIAGLTYLLEGARRYTLGALNTGAKPPVAAAIMKYNSTELGRLIVNDTMDVLGGNAISRGPANVIANTYIATPIGITVEGANILTRTLMIFGQGALRAHPYAYREVKSVEENDLKEFDVAFWSHTGHIVTNVFRSLILSLTRGRLAVVPVAAGPLKRYYQKLAWSSASFALMTDIAMAGLGGKLKVKEKLTGRFADVLSWSYLIMATLRRWEADGRLKEDLPFVHWSVQYGFARMQDAFDGIFGNFDVPVIGTLLKWIIRPWSRLNVLSGAPSDYLGSKIAGLIRISGPQRDRLIDGIYRAVDPKDPHSLLGRAFELTQQAEVIYAKVRVAIAEKTLPRMKPSIPLFQKALEVGVISKEEFTLLADAEKSRDLAIQVDSFDLDEYKDMGLGPRGMPAKASSTPQPISVVA